MRLAWTNKNQKCGCIVGGEGGGVRRETSSPSTGRTRSFHSLRREHQGDAVWIDQSSGDEGFGTGAVEVGTPDFTVIDVTGASIYPVHLGDRLSGPEQYRAERWPGQRVTARRMFWC